MKTDELGPSSGARLGGLKVSVRLFAATETPSYSLEILPGTQGGAFAFFKASGLGPVPAALAAQASTQFRERVSTTGGAGQLTSFAKTLNENLATGDAGKFLMCTLGSISAEGEVVLVPVGDPDIFVWREAERAVRRLKFSSVPALGVMSSEVLAERHIDFKAFKVVLAPGDRLVFVQGEFVDSSIAPSITAALASDNVPPGEGPILDSVVAALKEEEYDGRAPSWPSRPLNDSFVAMLSRES